MKEGIDAMNQASEPGPLKVVASRFERIARAEENQWLPWYCASYATLNVVILTQDPPMKEPPLDQAQQYKSRFVVKGRSQGQSSTLF